MIGRVLRFGMQVPKTTRKQLIPVDWMFHYFPKSTADRYRFMIRYNQVWTVVGFYMMWWAHQPYGSTEPTDSNLPLFYRWKLAKSVEDGTLETNLKVKYTSFYAGEEEEE
jgi:hypothetical protein